MNRKDYDAYFKWRKQIEVESNSLSFILDYGNPLVRKEFSRIVGWQVDYEEIQRLENYYINCEGVR